MQSVIGYADRSSLSSCHKLMFIKLPTTINDANPNLELLRLGSDIGAPLTLRVAMQQIHASPVHGFG